MPTQACSSNISSTGAPEAIATAGMSARDAETKYPRRRAISSDVHGRPSPPPGAQLGAFRNPQMHTAPLSPHRLNRLPTSPPLSAPHPTRRSEGALERTEAPMQEPLTKRTDAAIRTSRTRSKRGSESRFISGSGGKTNVKFTETRYLTPC